MSAAPSIDTHLDGFSFGDGSAIRDLSSRVKGYMAEVREHLEVLHAGSAASGAGRAVNEANSDLNDRLVRRLVALAEDEWLAGGGKTDGVFCVAAVGGYARREMSIHSDVDLLLLYKGKLNKHVAHVAERLQQWLWDAGVQVGCATRTIAETLKLGREDATVRTAVLMARYLVGDGEFFHDFADAVREGLLPKVETFIAEQGEMRRARHEEFGESLFLLQPNLKEGAGGLRDYHSAYWVLRAAQPSARDIDDLLHFGLLTEEEMGEFREALDFLWRVRNDLHLRAKRAVDQMSFEIQEQIAGSLGYSESENELSVERFMRDYYRHARAIESYSQLVIDQCAARVRPSQAERLVEEVEDGFGLAEGHLEIPHASHLREDPLRLLRAFEVAQQHGVPLSRMARRLLRENLSLIDDAFQRSPEASAIFLRMLDAEQRVTRTLMAMNEVGLLGAYIPEWEHIVCRWQHVIYHTYTVDVHSIFLVEELRRLWQGKYEGLTALTELIQKADDRPVLFLGCLLHDIGKGFGGNHSNKGAELAVACVERLGLSPERAERVIFLVREHLYMSHVAQRRDLADPKLILEFSQRCGDRTNLRNLYLMTFADIRASSREAFTGWKAQLLHELYERCAECLETGADDSSKAMALIEARVETRRDGAAKELRELGIAESRIHEYFEGMPRRYFMGHTPRQIARHARVANAYGAGQTFAIATREMRGGFSELILWTPDGHELFSRVAGTLTASGFDILGAHVYTTRDGLALEVFRVRTPPGDSEVRALAWRDFETRLERVLAGAVDVSTLLSSRRRRKVEIPNPEPATVSVSNEISDFYTVADVSATDRPGLLYELTRTLGEHGLEIYISKAATIRDQVADTFYVKDAEGRKLRTDDAIRALEDALCRAVGGDARPKSGRERAEALDG